MCKQTPEWINQISFFSNQESSSSFNNKWGLMLDSTSYIILRNMTESDRKEYETMSENIKFERLQT